MFEHCEGCPSIQANKVLPDSWILGDKSSVIHGVVPPVSSLFDPYEEGNIDFYDRVCIGTFGKSLLSFLVIYPGWGCYSEPTKKTYRVCKPFREEIRQSLVAPRYYALFGPEVIKHEVMRGESCPDLLVNPGKPLKVTGKKTKVILLPDQRYASFSDQHRKTRERCAEGLMSVIREVYGA